MSKFGKPGEERGMGLKQDAGTIKFPVNKDGSMTFMGKKVSSDISQDINKYVKTEKKAPGKKKN